MAANLTMVRKLEISILLKNKIGSMLKGNNVLKEQYFSPRFDWMIYFIGTSTCLGLF